MRHVWRSPTRDDRTRGNAGSAGFALPGCRAVHDVAFAPDGLILAGGGDGAVRLWDASTGHLLRTLTAPGAARVWDPKTGRERRSPSGQEYAVRTVSFSPDGDASPAPVATDACACGTWTRAVTCAP